MELSIGKYATWALSPVLVVMAVGYAIYGMCVHIATGKDFVMEVEEG